MSLEPNEFEALRKLLALKRHELPPPGYFSRLPDKIAVRLERGEGRLSLWERISAGFTFRPAFAYSFALAAFGALTFSVIDSVRAHPQESAQMPSNNGWPTGTSDAALASDLNANEPMHVANWMANVNASNPAPALPSLFDSSLNHPVVPVHFASP